MDIGSMRRFHEQIKMVIKIKAHNTTMTDKDMKVYMRSKGVTFLNAQPAAARDIKELNVVKSDTDKVLKLICMGV
jgi:arginine repressor